MADTPAQHHKARAIIAITASVFALSLGDALIKATRLSLPLWQMYVLRSALTVPVLWALARRHGRIRLHAPGWVLLRSLLLFVMWLSYYAALPLMPLSLAAAAYYTGPLFIVALVAILAWRWPANRALLAILCGFVGVILVIRPDTSGFQIGTLLPVAAAVFYACAMVLTSIKCRDDNPLVLALALNAVFIIGGAGLGLFAGAEASFILGPWQPLSLHRVAIVAALAVLILIGSVGAAIAYQQGPPATVAVFDYGYLAFSVMWGALFFGELPGALALTGIAVIFAAGLLTLPPQGRPGNAK
ncbi:DMT family transporter [uncultured Roseobacter sp.]|uniref:DMT family transporter n=1 Tax=uncultured Roseobacter sp. TaxID=114847 RepID=UPI00261FF7FB|nr:DMT family transporter [uncultured Roseobacter sp.]